MFTLMREAENDNRVSEAELFSVFATREAAASELESVLDANRASGEHDEEAYEAAWLIVPICDVEEA